MLIQIAQFLLGLSLLIVIHEFGHFLPAKYFGIKVSKFYLFFDYKFSILKKKIGETEWGIGWIPLGGYVKIEGMVVLLAPLLGKWKRRTKNGTPSNGSQQRQNW